MNDWTCTALHTSTMQIFESTKHHIVSVSNINGTQYRECTNGISLLLEVISQPTTRIYAIHTYHISEQSLQFFLFNSDFPFRFARNCWSNTGSPSHTTAESQQANKRNTHIHQHKYWKYLNKHYFANGVASMILSLPSGVMVVIRHSKCTVSRHHIDCYCYDSHVEIATITKNETVKFAVAPTANAYRMGK